MIKLGVSGACGRMGLRIITLANKGTDFTLTHAIEHENHPDIGKDIGLLTENREIGVKITSKITDGDDIDVLIDFSSPTATMERIRECSKNNAGIVIGTTGLNNDQTLEVTAAGKTIPCLIAPNMSLGVNLIFDIVARVAKALGDEYDIEIVETHHKLKKDAPSGTALRIAERICETTGKSMDNDVIYGRHGQVGERKEGEIGVHAVRLSDVVGIHKVIFDSSGDCIEITHDAHSRDTFASGALKAAKFIANRTPGMYNMKDVLNIKA